MDSNRNGHPLSRSHGRCGQRGFAQWQVWCGMGGLGPQHVHFPVLAESYLYRRTANTPWQMVTEGLPEPKGTIAHILKTHEEEPGVFYAASGRGVYRSADQGQTWQRLGITIPAHYRWQRTYGLIVR
jgi:hypothetical protein